MYKNNKKYLGKKPNFGILGLNPHNSSSLGEKGKDRIIYKAIKELKRKGVSVSGPLSPDSSFVIYKKYKFYIVSFYFLTYGLWIHQFETCNNKIKVKSSVKYVTQYIDETEPKKIILRKMLCVSSEL